MNLVQEARMLVQNLDQRMGPSPYDTAWTARVRQSGNSHPRWPNTVDWLLTNQHADGSWGGKIHYYHDRIICTVAAAIALRQNADHYDVESAIARAEAFVWRNLHLLPRDPFEMVGFELLIPTLLADARELDLNVPNHTCGYGKIQTAKLRLIPPQMLYSPRISTIHSLEFLGKTGDRDKMCLSLGGNGSLGNSPATTAYYLALNGGCEDEKALRYLEETLARSGYFIYLYPFRTFELTWVLHTLAFSGRPVTEFAGPAVWETLLSEIGPNGIGLDPSFGIADGDITSVTSRLLIQAGYEIDPAILARFEHKETHIFRTYDYERNISVGTNLHALETLELMPNYPNRYQVIEEVILKLLDARVFNIYWIDKWHASPYYATAHVLVGLLRGGSYLLHVCQYTIDWILHNQREDGSWGFYDQSTPEETAYAMITLLYYHQYAPLPADIFHRAADYLMRTYPLVDTEHPELWIGKCLYIPYDLVSSTILAALILYEDIFGRRP
jgi:halimadienyl-diphosphate synthase